jgi:DNA-binding GntR family transcriptional regulator
MDGSVRGGTQKRSALAGYRTKTQLVYEELREAIRAGHYPPGSRLVADQIADAHGTSKVPVREAIVRLAGEGWLEIHPHVGAVVARLSPDEVLETSIVRATLESRAVRFAADRLTARDLSHLRALLVRMDAAVSGAADDYPELNFQFHSAVFLRCPYPLLRELTTSMAERSLKLRTVRFLPAYLPDTQREHWELLGALERHDADAAERITRDHIERAGRLLSQFARDQAKGAAPGAPRRARPRRRRRPTNHEG